MMEKDIIVTSDGKVYRLLKSRQEIEVKIKELAQKIKQDYLNTRKPPILLFVANGGLYFGVDLSRSLESINCAHQIDIVQLKRNYPDNRAEALVNIVSRPQVNLGGRHVIVAEDLIDEGASMNFLYEFLATADDPPASINFCTLFVKEHHEVLDFELKYFGWTIGPNWLIGNGMDDAKLYRGLVNVYQVE